ncbi:MAG: hypothetical protein QOD38_1357 [Acidimicrobiaceae bacterium]
MKKLKTSELVMLGGAVAVFLGTFLTWFKAEVKGFEGFDVGGASSTVNGFHYFLQGTLPWILAIAVAAVIIIKAFVPNVKLPDTLGPLSWAQAYLVAGGLIALLILSRLLIGESGNSFVDVSRGIGLYLASLGAIAIAVGAFLKYQGKEEDAAPSGGPPTAF